MVVVSTDGGKVSCGTPDGRVINININQQSCLDSLLDTIKTVRAMGNDGQDNTPINKTHFREPLVAGVTCIILGCFDVMLGVLIAVVQPNLDIYDFSAHFWVGFPFIVSGMLNIVAYKNPKAFWVILASISLLGCLAVTIAGLVFIHRDLTDIWWQNSPLCDQVHQSYPYYGNDSMKYYNSNEAEWCMERCKIGFRQYQKLLFGVVVMSSIVIACGLSICIVALNYSLQMISSSCKCDKAEEETDDPFRLENPTIDLIF